MTAETFSPGTKGIITNLEKLIRWEHLKSTWSTLLCYPNIWPRKVPSHRRIFLHFCYLNFMKFTFLGFHAVVATREDLSIDISITNVGLILTKLWWFQLVNTSWNSFWKFKKIQIFVFPWCSTRKDLSIDVSFTNVGLILTKLRWFQIFSTIQNSISNFFEGKILIFGFLCCSTREDLSIDVSISY